MTKRELTQAEKAVIIEAVAKAVGAKWKTVGARGKCHVHPSAPLGTPFTLNCERGKQKEST